MSTSNTATTHNAAVDSFLRRQKDDLASERPCILHDALAAAEAAAAYGLSDKPASAELQFHAMFLLLSANAQVVEDLNANLAVAETLNDERKAVKAARAVIEVFKRQIELIVAQKLYEYPRETDVSAEKTAVETGLVLAKYYLQTREIYKQKIPAKLEELKAQRQPFEEAVHLAAGSFEAGTMAPFERLATRAEALSVCEVRRGEPVFVEVKKLESQWILD